MKKFWNKFGTDTDRLDTIQSDQAEIEENKGIEFDEDHHNEEQPIYFENRFIKSEIFEKALKTLVKTIFDYKERKKSKFRMLTPKLIEDFINK